MSNNLNGNPLILDTAMTTSYKAQVAATVGTLFLFRVEKIYWVAPSTSGDTYSIQDGTGVVLAQGTCSGALISQVLDWSTNPRLWRDFQMTQISSGKIEIYFKY